MHVNAADVDNEDVNGKLVSRTKPDLKTNNVVC